MSKRITSFRFPYFFIGVALVVAIFYRSPQGNGTPAGASISLADADERKAAISPASAISTGGSSLPVTEPVVSAPSETLVADLTHVSPPAPRKSAVPEGSSPESSAPSRAPEIPEQGKERIYLPDSYTNSTPVVPDNTVSGKVKIIIHGNESMNQIALTFDDGPSSRTTPQVLDILKQYNIKATFFVLGIQVKENPAILRRIVAEGHEIGNHSFNHPQLTKLTDEAVREQLVSTQHEIRKVVGFVPTMLRPPYGAYKPKMIPLFEELGFHVVLWSVDTNDWRYKGDAIERTASRETRNGSIILFHDIKKETVRVLPQIVEELLGRGFKPVTVSELTGLPANDNSAPPVARASAPEPAPPKGELVSVPTEPVVSTEPVEEKD